MKKITIHQPNYMPWSGFFHKWMLADTFVILDTVQYHKNEWQNRNQIKTAQGAQWVTVPVTYRFPQTIHDVGIAPENWAKKQISSIEQAYAKAPFFNDYWPKIKTVLLAKHTKLVDLNVDLIQVLGSYLGCTTPLLLASKLPISSEDPTQRLIEITKHLKGNVYLSGSEGKHYLDKKLFTANGISLLFQDIKPPEYKQLHDGFIPYLSVLDVLFNIGEDAQLVIRDMGEMQS